jgi:transposase-like protein
VQGIIQQEELSPERASARGFRVSGAVIMRPRRGDGYLTTAEAARLAGVSVNTIYSWRNRGHLAAQGLDENGRPLHTPEAVRAAERRVRENGLAASGIDPRRLRRAA